MTTTASQSEYPALEVTISRTLNAPRERVFRAWTNADEVRQWWGPKGYNTLHCTLDLHPGGLCHYRLQSPESEEIWGKLVYRQITPREKLIFVTSFSDENGGTLRHPAMPDWPRDMLAIVEFEEHNRQTTITFRWIPANPTETERKLFAEHQNTCRMVWAGTLDKLEAHLTNP